MMERHTIVSIYEIESDLFCGTSAIREKVKQSLNKKKTHTHTVRQAFTKRRKWDELVTADDLIICVFLFLFQK